MPVIGTAGHVDHGKSTLVRQISGRDPDRWAEEKRRGLTIDLGFAWATLPGGIEVSFVDVPGHERFLKNMLAGIEAIDVALLVVAADEGWMPQSEEHAAVLDLLEVRRGVVALTKTDLVDEDLLAIAAEEVADRLLGTTLQGIPVVPVSAVSGNGLATLLEALASQLPETDGDMGRPRLWVDRSFAAPGVGTVVTGTLIGGSLSVEDLVEIHPGSVTARIRGIQSHETRLDRVGPARRVALNLAGVDHDDVARGDMLGLPGQWEPTVRFTAAIRSARDAPEIDTRGAYQLHVGSASERVEVTGIRQDRAVLRVARPLPLAAGDRFIIRDTGRKMVIGGGRLLDPAPGPTGVALTQATGLDADQPPDELAQALLAIRRIEEVGRLAAHTGGGRAARAARTGNLVVDHSHLDELVSSATSIVSDHHHRHPLRAGLPSATLAERMDLPPAVVELIVETAAELERRGPDVAHLSHLVTPDQRQTASWERAVGRLRAGLAVPEESELGLDPELIHLKVRSGDLVRVAPGLVYLPEQIDELRSLIAGMGDGFTVAQFRDVAGLSRKYAVPILEWADGEGLTVRRGDVRGLR